MKKFKKICFVFEIVLAVILVIVLTTYFICKISAKETRDLSTLVKLDNEPIMVYSSPEEAKENSIISPNKNRTLTVSYENVKIKGSFDNLDDLPSVGVIVNNLEGVYTLKLSYIPIETTLLVEINLLKKERNSFVSNRLNNGYDDAEKYYLSFSIEPCKDENNLNLPDGIDNLITMENSEFETDSPSGTILINGVIYSIYEDAEEARNNSTLLTSYSARNPVTFSARPGEGTIKAIIEPRYINEEKVYKSSITLSNSSNWSGELNLSKYAGKKVTLAIRFESTKIIVENNHFFVTLEIPQDLFS
jgi:hypothetical protein